jgi:ParB family chromosome partitioning protein
MAKPALGRGLGALLGGSSQNVRTPSSNETARTGAATPLDTPPPVADNSKRVQLVPVERIHPCSFQPRKSFTEQALQELADSIREQGIVQPLIVRERHGRFEIIAGERRWRASQIAGLKELPVIVREADDRTVLELALIENLQRENLNPLEEAQGYSQLIGQFNLTQEQAAVKVGKSRTVVANALRILKLPASIQVQLRDGTISVGHAKVILGLPTETLQIKGAERVVKDGLNVRQTEELVAKLNAASTLSNPSVKPSSPTAARDANLAALENQLREKFGTKVRFKYNKGKGSMEIGFFSDDELNRILGLLGIQID